MQRKYSVAKIDTSDTYEKGQPKAGGLSDLRMGTMDKGGVVCTTDAVLLSAQSIAALAPAQTMLLDMSALHASGAMYHW